MADKTILYSTSWLEGEDHQGCNMLERTKRWLNYYRQLKSELGFQWFYLAENASPQKLIDEVEADDVLVHRFKKGLYRDRTRNNYYPYCWRGYYHLSQVMNYCDKIIVCDTDAFILSARLANHIREMKSGYETMWSPRYQFPACEISVICADAFPYVRAWMNQEPWETRAEKGILFEKEPPFTRIAYEFVGDRYGEFFGDVQQTDEMDFYTQARTPTVLRFNRERK